MYSIYQTETYFRIFDVRSEEFEYNGITFYYLLENSKFMKIRSELMTIEISEDLVNYIFDTFDVNKITFSRLLNSKYTSKNTISEIVLDDYILELKTYSCFGEYLLSFGKKTRQHLRYYRRQFDEFIVREHHYFFYNVLALDENPYEFEKIGNAIIDLNQRRCIGKGIKFGTDRRIIKMCSEIGRIAYYKLDDNLIAGTLFTVLDDQIYLHVISHDNKWSCYNIGNLILLDTIEYAYNIGIKQFHFLWGDCEYKRRFGAVRHDLCDVIVYKFDLEFLIKKICLKTKDVLRKLKKMLRNLLIKIVGERIVDKICQTLKL